MLDGEEIGLNMATIIDMLVKNAQKYPDDIALIELRPSKNLRQTITWKQFNDDANRVANYLLDRGTQGMTKSFTG